MASTTSKDGNAPIVELFKEYVLPTYSRLPYAMVKGRGVYLFDANGKKFLDFVSGLAVNNLGHCPKEVVAALKKQAGELIHCANFYHIPGQGLLAKKLCELTGLSRAFFCNSGAEANEACLKLARYYAHQTLGLGRHQIIVAEQSFHGRTMGALSATSQKKYQEGFDPLVPGFKSVPFNDKQAILDAINENTCAIWMEPIQGEGGVNIPSDDYFPFLRKTCDEKNLLLIADEVQTGVGRTGTFLATQHYGIVPDLVALAKGLGSGFPLGACLVSEKIAQLTKPGIHASTFGGNPLACAAGLATLQVIGKKSFLKSVEKIGAYFLAQLQKLQAKHFLVESVGGKGLMLRMELKQTQGEALSSYCLKRGLLINVIRDKVIRLVPPLIVEKAHVAQAIEILDEGLTHLSP